MARDHHQALKSEVIEKVNAGHIEIVVAKLQSGKDDKAFTLHVNPSSYSTSGLQTTDWLGYLGFKRNDRCPFTNSHRCYSKEVPEGFDAKAFATAFNAGYGHVQEGEKRLSACGFVLPQPEGWGFFYGQSDRGREYRGPASVSGDGHTGIKAESMKQTEDDKFLFRFTFLDTGREKAFVTHYRPKHPPLSSELRSVFKYLGLKEFKDCPEFDFEECYFRTVAFVARGDDMWSGNVDSSHRAFDAHQQNFSRGIEALLAANVAVEEVGITYLPFEKPSVRMNADIVRQVTRPAKAAPPPKSLATAPKPPQLPDSFDVAISFAGTERPQAEELAKIVRDAGYAVFYDNFYPEHLWGKNLTIFFDEIFRKRARFCVMFVSKEYRDRKWTSHEARSAQARALEEKGDEYILPIRADDTELEGLLPTVGYVPIATGVDKIGEMLLKKLRARSSA